MELYAVVDVVKDPGTRLAQTVSILEGPFNMETPGVSEQDVIGWARENVASMLADHLPGFAVDSVAVQRIADPRPSSSRHVSAGPVEVDLALPELPDGVGADIHLVVKPKTEEEARAVLESFGGLAAFEEIRDSAWPVATIHGDGMTIGVQLPATRPVRSPFAVELIEEQRASNEVAKAEVPGPPNPLATDERPVG